MKGPISQDRPGARIAAGVTAAAGADPPFARRQIAGELLEQGQRAALNGHREPAYRFFCQALELDPTHAEAWLWRAGTSLEPEEARSCLERVLQLDPTNRRARLGLSELGTGPRPADGEAAGRLRRAVAACRPAATGLAAGLGLLLAAGLLLTPRTGEIVRQAEDAGWPRLMFLGATPIIEQQRPVLGALPQPSSLGPQSAPVRDDWSAVGKGPEQDQAVAEARPPEAATVVAAAEVVQASAPQQEARVDSAEPTSAPAASREPALASRLLGNAAVRNPGTRSKQEDERGEQAEQDSDTGDQEPLEEAQSGPPRRPTGRPWVAVHRATGLWSGVDGLAKRFGLAQPGRHFQVAQPQDGPRLYVWDPETGNYAYIAAEDVGPARKPAKKKAAKAEVPDEAQQAIVIPPKGDLPFNPRDTIWTGTARVSMYTCVELGGCNRTASGIWPYEGVVAVDPRVIPLGSMVWLEGLGTFLAADTGGAIHGNRIDVFVHSYPRAIQWGVRYVPAAAYRGS